MAGHSNTDPKKTRQILTRALETIREAVSEVCKNMRIIEEKRNYTEKRLENLKNNIPVMGQTASELAAVQEEAESLRLQLGRISAERDVLIQQVLGLDRILQEETHLANKPDDSLVEDSAEKDKVANFNDQLKKAQLDIDATKRVLEVEKTRAIDLNRQLIEQGEALTGIKQEFVGARQRVKTPASSNKNSKKGGNNLKQELAAVRHELEKMRNETEATQSQLAFQLNDLKEERKSLLSDLEEARRRQANETQNQAQELDPELPRLQKSLELVTSEKAQLDKELKDTRTRADEAQAFCRWAHEAVQGLREEVVYRSTRRS